MGVRRVYEEGMLEKVVEMHLKEEVKKAGGETRKARWVNRRGAPDEAVLFGGVYFVELKRPGGELNPHQLREHVRMRRLGVEVFVLDSLSSVDRFIQYIKDRKDGKVPPKKVPANHNGSHFRE